VEDLVSVRNVICFLQIKSTTNIVSTASSITTLTIRGVKRAVDSSAVRQWCARRLMLHSKGSFTTSLFSRVGAVTTADVSTIAYYLMEPCWQSKQTKVHMLATTSLMNSFAMTTLS